MVEKTRVCAPPHGLEVGAILTAQGGDVRELLRASRGVFGIDPVTGPADIRAFRVVFGIGPALVAGINPNHRI